MYRIIGLLILTFNGFCVNAQWTDSFFYTDLNSQTDWVGNTGYFTLENGMLRSNSDSINGSFYISRKVKATNGFEWKFYVNLKFNTSSANFCDVYLWADSADLLKPRNGYFVRIGNTKDEVCLYQAKKGFAPSLLIDGRDNLTAGNSNPMQIRVVKDSSGKFELYTDVNVAGNEYFEGSFADTAKPGDGYAGIYIKQSTASFHKKHYFDNFTFRLPPADVIAPFVTSALIVNDTTIKLSMSEPVQLKNAADSCFFISLASNNVISVSGSQQLVLVFKNTFEANKQLNLNVRFLADASNNVLKDTIIGLYYFKPSEAGKKDILITELMADPDPSQGLPAAEYVEILNRSNKPLTLKNLFIADPSKTTAFPDSVLLPGEYAIVCDLTNQATFAGFGKVVPVIGLPSLNNTSDLITIKNAAGLSIHEVAYSDTWYGDNSKKDGGWSLEMIDTGGLCFESGNWKASAMLTGGTPGKVNSVNAYNRDMTAPSISGFQVFQSSVSFSISEDVDSQIVVNTANYISTDFNIAAISYDVAKRQVIVKAVVPFVTGIAYKLSVIGFADCSGNVMPVQVLNFILPDTAQKGDVVINEILFNPRTGGYDYVEILNVSNKKLDLQQLKLANYDSVVRNIVPAENNTRILSPGEYAVFTVMPFSVISQYPYHDSTAFVALAKMPSLSNDKGNIYLLNSDSSVIDFLIYDEKMHHSLIENTDGVSLEKINPDISSALRSNWTSAASTYYYGTPGLPNSQYSLARKPVDKLIINKQIFSPDGDGYDDVLLFSLQSSGANNLATVLVMDISGRKVKEIASNFIIGNDNMFQWDGFDENGNMAPIGVYIIYAETWGGDEIERIKVPVTLGGVLNR